MLPLLAEQAITWIKVPRPTFDLVGVVLSSLGLAGICAGVALSLGTALGVGFIVRGRRAPQTRLPLRLTPCVTNRLTRMTQCVRLQT
jgi:hypothetical protein